MSNQFEALSRIRKDLVKILRRKEGGALRLPENALGVIVEWIGKNICGEKGGKL